MREFLLHKHLFHSEIAYYIVICLESKRDCRLRTRIQDTWEPFLESKTKLLNPNGILDFDFFLEQELTYKVGIGIMSVALLRTASPVLPPLKPENCGAMA